MTDSEARDVLQACAAGGDSEDWLAFRDRFEPRMRSGVIRAFRRAGATPPPETLEDLLQETYCKLLAREGRVLRNCESEEAAGIAAYLARVAERVAIDHLRRGCAEKRGSGRLDSLETITEREGEGKWLAVQPEAEAQMIATERRERFLATCRRVAGRRRRRNVRVLRLAFLEGLTSREISRRLGKAISPNGIDSLLHRARRRLAEEGLVVPRRRTAGATAGGG